MSFAPNVPSLDSFIGYVYTTQIPNTSPRYIGCVLNPPIPKAQPSCQNSWFPTSDPSKPFASFMGYVYVDAPLTRYGLSPKYYVGSGHLSTAGAGPLDDHLWGRRGDRYHALDHR